jgi:hypothetical protein
MIATRKGYLGVKPPTFRRMEAEVTGGVARISQRHALVEAELVLSYDLDGVKLRPGDIVFMVGDSALKPWCTKLFVQPDGLSFALCPEAEVLAYKTVRPLPTTCEPLRPSSEPRHE